MKLGKFVNVNIRDKWPNEAQDFTPWLAEDENLQLLGSELGLELELEDIEVPVGPYSADILAKDTGSNRNVVIENQLEKTDHDHLGKAITYASVLDAVTVIWIAGNFTDEHKKAIDWLNDHTSEEISFYGIKLELVKIDDSNPAVRFNVLSEPSQVIKTAKQAHHDLTPEKSIQLKFWTMFKEKYLAKSKSKTAQTPSPKYWYNISLGRSDIHLSNTASVSKSKIGVRVYIRGKIADSAIEQLTPQREAIEAEIGEELQWNPRPENKDKVICLEMEADLANESNWDQYLDWMAEKTVAFRKAFSPRVKKMDFRPMKL